MNCKSLRVQIGYRLLAVFVSVAVIISMMPAAGLSGTDVYGAEGGLKIESPELAVTGTDVIGGKTYTADNIDLEKSYTRGELKKLEGGKEILYSSINTFDNPIPRNKALLKKLVKLKYSLFFFMIVSS